MDRETPRDYIDHPDHLGGSVMAADTWTVAEAKAKLSEVIERAQSGGPQTITRNGHTAVGLFRGVAAPRLGHEGQPPQGWAAQGRAVNFLLDTNVVSEWTKPRPDAGVVAWLAEIDEDRAFISVITLTELRYGIDRLAPGARRRRLDDWLRDELALRFEGRVLALDAAVADVAGMIMARRDALGRAIGTMDAFIAATAEHHALTLVTRDVADFAPSVTKIVCPWTG
jgi:predicted nucleic acid-binding protein